MFPDLGHRARLGVAAVWIAGQAALIGTGPRRAGGTFAFRMFPEASTIQIQLSREVVAPSGQGTVRVPVDGGRWLARDRDGVMHRFRWDDRVEDGNLFPWGAPVHASYGAAAQLERLARALDDVADHIPEDAETLRLVADVTVQRRLDTPAKHLELESGWRDVR
jgi:hypothetical protein